MSVRPSGLLPGALSVCRAQAYLLLATFTCSSFRTFPVPSLPSQGFQESNSKHCCQERRPRIPLVLSGSRSWALGISCRDRASLLGLLASSGSELGRVPPRRPGFRAAFSRRGLTALGPPCYCPACPRLAPFISQSRLPCRERPLLF